MTLAPKPGMSPLRFRLITTAVVAVLLVASHAALPDVRERAFAQYAFVITLGYGHLLGAALGVRWHRERSLLGGAFGVVTIATLFAVYVEALAAWSWLGLPLLALSVWHFTENDVALAEALRTGCAVGPLPRDAKTHGVALAAAALVVACAVAASPDEGLLADLFCASVLFHLVGWLVFLIARGASLSHLLALHAPLAALCAALLAWPGAAAAPLREFVFSSPIYLFWATLHVVDSALARGRALA